MYFRKLFTSIFLLAVATTLVTSAVASDNDTESYTTKSGNVYESGEKLIVNENIEGDYFASATELTINGNVDDNVFVSGGAILINGDVEGDIFAAGGYIVINGDINGDVRVASGELYVNSELIDGDFQVFAGKVSLADEVEITGEQNISAGTTNQGVSDNPIDLSDYEKGETSFGNYQALYGGFLVLGVVWSIIMIIGAIILAYAVLRLFPTFSEKTIVTVQNNFKGSLVAGLVTFIVGPILLVLLAVSVIGLKLSFFIIALFAVLAMIANALAGYMLGRSILRRFFKRKETGRLLPTVIGVTILEIFINLLYIIPFIGFIAAMLVKTSILVVYGGAIIYNKYKALKNDKFTK